MSGRSDREVEETEFFWRYLNSYFAKRKHSLKEKWMCFLTSALLFLSLQNTSTPKPSLHQKASFECSILTPMIASHISVWLEQTQLCSLANCYKLNHNGQCVAKVQNAPGQNRRFIARMTLCESATASARCILNASKNCSQKSREWSAAEWSCASLISAKIRANLRTTLKYWHTMILWLAFHGINNALFLNTGMQVQGSLRKWMLVSSPRLQLHRRMSVLRRIQSFWHKWRTALCGFLVRLTHVSAVDNKHGLLWLTGFRLLWFQKQLAKYFT